jgi:hypothetical protein
MPRCSNFSAVVLPVEQIINDELKSSTYVISSSSSSSSCYLYIRADDRVKQAEVHVFKMLVHFVHKNMGL